MEARKRVGSKPLHIAGEAAGSQVALRIGALGQFAMSTSVSLHKGEVLLFLCTCGMVKVSREGSVERRY